jgi:hypothetical protein
VASAHDRPRTVGVNLLVCLLASAGVWAAVVYALASLV